MQIIIRDVKLGDAEEILDIMSYYFENTAVHFSYVTPSIEDFKENMIQIMKKYPFFVLEYNGMIKGFAYASSFVNIPAYDWSCELTIYISSDFKRKGYGSKLYEILIDKLDNMGVKNLYACIAYTDTEDEHLNNSSMKFHEKFGFTTIAKFSKCGYKFNKWYDVIWMEKILSNHEAHPIKPRWQLNRY